MEKELIRKIKKKNFENLINNQKFWKNEQKDLDEKILSQNSKIMSKITNLSKIDNDVFNLVNKWY